MTDRAPSAVIHVEIDDFCRIGAAFGDAVSGALLDHASGRMNVVAQDCGGSVRQDGAVFHLHLDATPDAAENVALRLHETLRAPFDLGSEAVYVTASIGIGHLTESPLPPPARQAEIAAFAAKTAGGNRRTTYASDLADRLSRETRIVQGLRHALHTDRFGLAFQPKFALRRGTGSAPAETPCRMIGAEALLRWNAPGLGPVGPHEFIPVAEAAGMITDIDFHVMGIFARQLGHWHAQGHVVPASINLSPRSFEDDTLASRMLDLLGAAGVSPGDITVEITETSLITMSPHAMANLDTLRLAGVKLSIDDFGTGYSSLFYLHRLIVSEIKIDRSFIRSLCAGPPEPAGTAGRPDGGSDAIVRTILGLARSLGVRTVAEGVETAEQLEWLEREECHAIQGYLSGHALCPAAFERRHMRRRDASTGRSRGRFGGYPS